MKLFVYCVREFDEKDFFETYCRQFNCEFAYTTEYPSLENAHLARGCEAVSMTPCTIDRLLLEEWKRLGVRYLANRSIGVDHVDLDAARKLGFGVSHVQYDPETVADYAIMLMLMCCRKIKHILDRSLVQDYSLQGKLGREISELTVGIIGTGKIGLTVLKHLQGFGCRLLAYDVAPNPEAEKYAEYVSLDALYQQSDIISLHSPATTESYHMLNRETFSRMKNGVMIINTARGALIDTEALIEALDEGKVGAAALDVLEQEDGLYYKNRMGDAIVNHHMAILRAYPHVILTPHTAFYSDVVVEQMAEKVVETAWAMANGKAHPLILDWEKEKTQTD